MAETKEAKFKKSVRRSFSIPETDRQVIEWLDIQHSMSTSLRAMIKDFISRYGMVDASCVAASFPDSGSLPNDVNQQSAETQD